MTNLYTEGSALEVDTPAANRYLPVMPQLSGPGITFHTTNNDPKYVDGQDQKLYLVMMQDMGGPNYIPFLATDFGLWVEKDIETYGALMTTSDPAKGVGGGAILIGHGLDGPNDPPHIQLTDYAVNSDFGILRIYKLNSSWSREPGDLDIGSLIARDAIKSYNNGAGYYSYNGGGGGGASGGIYLDQWGNMKFNGGNNNNYWSIFNSWAGEVFRVPNQTGGTTAVLVNCNLNPLPSGTNYGIGSGSNRWAGIVVHDIYYGSLHPGFDMIDDLAYIKQIQTINITENGKTRQVIDPKTLKLFSVEVDETHPIRNDPKITDCTDLSKVIGFMLCCHKVAALKLEEHDTNFADVAKLKDEVAGLRTQVQALQGKTAA